LENIYKSKEVSFKDFIISDEGLFFTADLPENKDRLEQFMPVKMQLNRKSPSRLFPERALRNR